MCLWAKDTDPSFDPERNIVYGASEGIALAKTLPPGSVIMFDEGIEVASRRGWNSEKNKKMQIFINTCRKYRLIIVFIVPTPDDLDRAIAKHLHWVFTMEKPPGRGRVFRVEQIGLQNIKTWWNARQPFKFPDCAKADPELWDAYRRRVERYMAGVDEAQKNLVVGKLARVIRSVATDTYGPRLVADK